MLCAWEQQMLNCMWGASTVVMRCEAEDVRLQKHFAYASCIILLAWTFVLLQEKTTERDRFCLPVLVDAFAFASKSKTPWHIITKQYWKTWGGWQDTHLSSDMFTLLWSGACTNNLNLKTNCTADATLCQSWCSVIRSLRRVGCKRKGTSRSWI